MPTLAESLAEWAHAYAPDANDLALARRSLLDTLAVTLAGRDHEVARLAAWQGDAARWATVGHVLDFDDLHTDSTSHISVVVVPTVLAAGGDARAYLAGAGVMARLGGLLGWRHYAAGWHITCTAGAPAAAVAAGVARGLDARRLAHAMALALPAAGGVQKAFGTHAKSLQVGFAAEAGLRAARLAEAGAEAEPGALEAWLELLGGTVPADGAAPALEGPALPGGLALKMFPCCYAMQRPIAALREVRAQVSAAAGGPLAERVAQIRVSTPAATVQPLLHSRPLTGLEGKFSMEYAVATALLDAYPDFAAFTDEAVARPAAQRLLAAVEVERTAGGEGLLTGQVAIEVELVDGTVVSTALGQPPGSPERPPSEEELAAKLAACGPDVPELLADVDWAGARTLLAAHLPQLPLTDGEYAASSAGASGTGSGSGAQDRASHRTEEATA